MRAYFIVILLWLPLHVGAADVPAASNVVSFALSDVIHAIETYYSAESINGASGAWGRRLSSVTNAAGEAGITFEFCSCRSVPACYEIQATAVTLSTTRLEVRPLDPNRQYSDEQFILKTPAFTIRANVLLRGVVDRLGKKQ